MSVSAIVMTIIALGITWGGFATCLVIAAKHNDSDL